MTEIRSHDDCLTLVCGPERWGDEDYDAAVACVDQQPGRCHTLD